MDRGARRATVAAVPLVSEAVAGEVPHRLPGALVGARRLAQAHQPVHVERVVGDVLEGGLLGSGPRAERVVHLLAPRVDEPAVPEMPGQRLAGEVLVGVAGR